MSWYNKIGRKIIYRLPGIIAQAALGDSTGGEGAYKLPLQYREAYKLQYRGAYKLQCKGTYRLLYRGAHKL